MNPCVHKIVSIRGCSSEQPLYYLDDLPGLNIPLIANIADSGNPNAELISEKAIRNGWESVRNELRKVLFEYVRFDSATFAGFLNSFGSYVDAPAEVVINKSLCRMQAILIPYVQLKDEIGGQIEVVVTDGEQTQTHEITMLPGVVYTLYLNFKTNLDTVTITSDMTRPASGRSNGCCDCSIQGNGIRPLVHLYCDIDLLMCELGQYIGKAVQLAAGAMLLSELMLTQRVNQFTIYKQEQAIEVKNQWLQMAQSELVTFKDMAPKLIQQIAPCCISCSASEWTFSKP